MHNKALLSPNNSQCLLVGEKHRTAFA